MLWERERDVRQGDNAARPVQIQRFRLCDHCRQRQFVTGDNRCALLILVGNQRTSEWQGRIRHQAIGNSDSRDRLVYRGFENQYRRRRTPRPELTRTATRPATERYPPLCR